MGCLQYPATVAAAVAAAKAAATASEEEAAVLATACELDWVSSPQVFEVHQPAAAVAAAAAATFAAAAVAAAAMIALKSYLVGHPWLPFAACQM